MLNLELTKNPNTGVTDVTKVGYVPLYMLDREQEVGGERFTLLDAHRGIEEYASGDSSYISSSTEKKTAKMRVRLPQDSGCRIRSGSLKQTKAHFVGKVSRARGAYEIQ